MKRVPSARMPSLGRLAPFGLSALLVTGSLVWALGACGSEAAEDEVEAWLVPMLEKASGGDTTVADTTENAFARPLANLPVKRTDAHFVGNSFFNKNWVAAPATTKGLDGLGPIFNARSCSGCHFKDGRGTPGRTPNEEPEGLLVRLGKPELGSRSADVEVDPIYGGQIQNFALPGLKAEAKVRYRNEVLRGEYADGSSYELMQPIYRLEDLAHGPLAEGVRLSPRVTPQVIGLGLLEGIAEKDIMAYADADDSDGDGISGRPNRVWDRLRSEKVLGRFGWKAGQPTVAQQSAAAFNGDMGLTTSLFPDPSHTKTQVSYHSAPNGGAPEVDAKTFDFVVYYMKTLAPTARRDPMNPKIRRGAELFRDARCDRCHIPEFVTGVDPEFPELSGQSVRAYTDLLLHDMGEGLADEAREAEATGREWRTPPLWGIGLFRTVRGDDDPSLFLLHDGRARTVDEAILWHGGEGEFSREAFKKMSTSDREALVAFVLDL